MLEMRCMHNISSFGIHLLVLRELDLSCCMTCLRQMKPAYPPAVFLLTKQQGMLYDPYYQLISSAQRNILMNMA